jgi:hypothetical protein
MTCYGLFGIYPCTAQQDTASKQCQHLAVKLQGLFPGGWALSPAGRQPPSRGPTGHRTCRPQPHLACRRLSAVRMSRSLGHSAKPVPHSAGTPFACPESACPQPHTLLRALPRPHPSRPVVEYPSRPVVEYPSRPVAARIRVGLLRPAAMRARVCTPGADLGQQPPEWWGRWEGVKRV